MRIHQYYASGMAVKWNVTKRIGKGSRGRATGQEGSNISGDFLMVSYGGFRSRALAAVQGQCALGAEILLALTYDAAVSAGGAIVIMGFDGLRDGR
jgi:hypothetical protein